MGPRTWAALLVLLLTTGVGTTERRAPPDCLLQGLSCQLVDFALFVQDLPWKSHVVLSPWDPPIAACPAPQQRRYVAPKSLCAVLHRGGWGLSWAATPCPRAEVQEVSTLLSSAKAARERCLEGKRRLSFGCPPACAAGHCPAEREQAGGACGQTASCRERCCTAAPGSPAAGTYAPSPCPSPA